MIHGLPPALLVEVPQSAQDSQTQLELVTCFERAVDVAEEIVVVKVGCHLKPSLLLVWHQTTLLVYGPTETQTDNHPDKHPDKGPEGLRVVFQEILSWAAPIFRAFSGSV